MLPSERRRLERLNRSKRASLVFRNNPKTGKRERFSRADIDSNKKTANFFRDREKRIDKEIASVNDKIRDRRKNRTGSGIIDSITDAGSSLIDTVGGRLGNVDRSDALTGLGLLFSGTPVGAVFTALGIGNRLKDAFTKDPEVPTTTAFATDNDLLDLISANTGQASSLPVPRFRDGGMSFDAPPSLLNANRFSSVFPEQVGTQRVQTGTVDVSVPTGRQLQGGRPEIVIEQQPVFEDVPVMSRGLLGLLDDARIGSQSQMMPLPEPPNVSARTDLGTQASLLNLLTDANVGGSASNRGSQTFDTFIEATPLIRNALLGNNTVDISQDVIDSITKNLLEDSNYELPPVNFVGDPVLIENPIQALLYANTGGQRGSQATFQGEPQINLLATTPSGVSLPYEYMTPASRQSFDEQVGLLRSEATPYGLTVGFR